MTADRTGQDTSGKSVVLGLDTSPGAQRALAVAIRIARALDVPLVLVHGVEPPGRVGEEVGEAREAIEELDDRVTRPAVAAAEAAGVRAVPLVAGGRPTLNALANPTISDMKKTVLQRGFGIVSPCIL